jgi:hypothetical protein
MAKPVISITLLGDKELIRVFSSQNVAVSMKALRKSLYEEAWVIMNESQRRVPVDTGTLRRSRAVLPPSATGTIIEIEMGYGGAATEYAMKQHENPNYRHKSGQTWKYLEAPVREYMPVLQESLTKRLAFYLRSK